MSFGNTLCFRLSKIIILLFMISFLFISSTTFAQEDKKEEEILILYHSLTGNTKASCEALQQALQAEILEIKDLVDRKGKWGFFKTAIGSLFGRHTKIEPENPDLSSYSCIILGSPIWTGKLSMAIRTFIGKNSFEGKKVVIFTTTNAFEKEKYKEKSMDLIREKGGDVVGYFQVAVQEEINGEKIDKSKEQIISETLKFVTEIKKSFFERLNNR